MSNTNDIETVVANDPDFGYQGQEPNWTSVDLYYKGFHIKKSMPENVKPADLKRGIEEYIKEGFEPSWNSETNKANGHIATQTVIPKHTPTSTSVPICGIHNIAMVWKEGVSKSTNKPYAFWSCPQKNVDGTWCKFQPEK